LLEVKREPVGFSMNPQTLAITGGYERFVELLREETTRLREAGYRIDTKFFDRGSQRFVQI